MLRSGVRQSRVKSGFRSRPADTRTRTGARRGRIVTALTSCLVLGSGCSGSSSSLDITCGEFLEASQETQRALAADWTDENSTLSSEMTGVVTGSRRMLADHCEDNLEDRLLELEVDVGR